MGTVLSNCRVSSHRHLLIAGILLLVLFCLPAALSAQQPTATISSLSGQVFVSLQGKKAVAATVGVVLQAGDIIETQAGAEVVLTLSEVSELQLGENTKVDIAVLTQKLATGARVSRVKLLWGRIRAFLSPEHQEEGSSFNFETPNALVGVKFSQPDVEVIYKPETKTTIIIGYTVAVTVTNLLTKEVKRMPKAHQAIVQDEFLWITPFTPGVEEIPPEEKQRQTRIRMLLKSQQNVSRIVSPVPVSAGGRAKTSRSPGVGAFSEEPRPQTLTINTSEE